MKAVELAKLLLESPDTNVYIKHGDEGWLSPVVKVRLLKSHDDEDQDHKAFSLTWEQD